MQKHYILIIITLKFKNDTVSTLQKERIEIYKTLLDN